MADDSSQEDGDHLVPLFIARKLKSPVKKSEWNPKGNLIAAVHLNDRVSLSRRDVYPIWSFIAPGSAEAGVLAWNPKGTAFAVGCANGTVLWVDATYSKPKSSTCWPEAHESKRKTISYPAITALQWINYYTRTDDAAEINACPMKRLDFKPLPRPLLAHGIEPKGAPLPAEPARIQSSTLLLIGDANGDVHLCLDHSYHIGTIHLNTGQKMPNSVVDICLNCEDSQLEVSLTSDTNGVQKTTLLCDVLSTRQKALCNIADIHREVNFLLEYIRQCLQVVREHHNSIVNLVKRFHNDAIDYLKRQQEETDHQLHAELLGILATGNTTKDVKDFITEEVSEQNLKSWNMRSLYSYSCINTIIYSNIEPAIVRLKLQLSKLSGYSQWTEQYDALLDKAQIDLVSLAVNLLFTRTFAYSMASTNVSKRFKEFSTWISYYKRIFSDEEAQEYSETDETPVPWDDFAPILEFLEYDLVNDRLSEYIQVNTDLKLDGDITDDSWKRATLFQILDMIEEKCKIILSTPATEISKNIQPHA